MLLTPDGLIGRCDMPLYLKRLPEIEYLEPTTIKEICFLLSQYKEEAKVIAGGTDLLVQMKNRILTPKYLISLKKFPSLGKIIYDETNGLKIGALARLQDIKTSPIIKKKFTALFEAVYNMASIQIRNLATIGGNICNALPSADTAPPLLALNAKLKVVGVEGERIIPIEDFFKAPGETVLNSSEILTEIQIDTPPPFSRSTYIKHSLRNAMDLALVGVGVFIQLSSANGTCEEARISLGACAPTPIRAKKAEGILHGSSLSDEIIKKAAELASYESRPRKDSFRSSVEYRREMIRSLMIRAINNVMLEMKKQT